MNTLHFKYAVEIEKTRSITQAAENLYMAQPNMSKAIKELENTLGITIFRRTSKGVIPTEQGMKFLEYAKQVLIQIDNMEAIHSPGKQQKQKMRISVPRSSYISCAFTEFAADFDTSNDIETYLRETNSMQTISDVREHCYDFGIIRFKMDHEKYFMDYLAEKSLASQHLWDYEMLAVMSAEHPMADAEKIEYSELCGNYTEISQGDSMVPYLSPSDPAVTEELHINGAKRRRICVFDRGTRFDLISSVPQTFMLDSPIPAEICRRYDLVQRKCSFEGNSYRDILIYVSGHKLSDGEIQFVNKVYEVRNRVAFSDFY
ncbi:MAG: LysR family transcriptional regulator [Ruminococcus sp.]|nr:LysR family transcriptional regulator [Ruminococcus sp.]